MLKAVILSFLKVSYRMLDPVYDLFIVIKVNIVSILKSSNRHHCVIALVIWV